MSEAKERERDVTLARRLADVGELDAAYDLADKWLNVDPNDGPMLTVLTSLMIQSEKKPVAYHLSKKLCELLPNNAASWINMGQVSHSLWLIGESKRAYRHAARLKTTARQKSMILINMCALMIDLGKWDEGEKHALAAQKLRETELFEEDKFRDENDNKALANLSFCQLAKRQWKEGFKNYRKTIGHDIWRPRNKYNNEPEWDGEEVKKLVLYGEQGIGDQISFASLIRDCEKKAESVVLDVDSRLTNLFRRSFPECSVYGTLGFEKLPWKEEHQNPDASLPMGQSAEYFRHKTSDFPGTPYLVPCPDRVEMWQALWEKKDKPVIAITWQGGIPRTGSSFRKMSLEELLPVFESVDAHWVTVHYKDTREEVAEFKKDHPEIDIGEYPWATLSDDLDDVTALIASVDMVLTMQQTAGHIAGAVGTPAWVFVTQNSQWRYGLEEHEDMPWYKCMRLIRQKTRGDWTHAIQQVKGELGAYIEGIRGRAKKTA